MGDLVRSDHISDEDYNAIEEAVMETARGRWFLAEYAKRNRVSDTQQVLGAINSLKSFITREHEPTDALQLRLDIADMAQKMEQIKRDVANSEDEKGEISNAQFELNVVVDETEAATSTILSAAESVQEIAWQMSENGVPQEYCDKFDALATEVYLACSFQDLTGQRLRKIVHLFKHIEERFQSMLDLWSGDELSGYRAEPTKNADQHLVNGPALPGNETQQADIDTVMASEEETADDNNAIEWVDDGQPDDEEDEAFIIDDFEEADLYQATNIVSDDMGTTDQEEPVAELQDDAAFSESEPDLEPMIIENEVGEDEVGEDDPVEGEAFEVETSIADDDADLVAFEEDAAEEEEAPLWSESEAADPFIYDEALEVEPAGTDDGAMPLQARMAQFT